MSYIPTKVNNKVSSRVNAKVALVSLFSSLVSSLVFTLPSLGAYVPPNDRVPPRARGGTAGRRSACEFAEAKSLRTAPDSEFLGLVALAPASHVGNTVSDRPSLAWYTHNCNSVPIQLSIYEYDLASNKLQAVPLFTQQLDAQPGINRFRLPENGTVLESGKTYAWQVVAIADTPAKSAWFRVPLQVVPQPASLEKSLQPSNSGISRVETYASAGFWYDALSAALDGADPTQVSSLLNQLAQLEAQTEPREQPVSRRFSESLIKVAKSLQMLPLSQQLSVK